MNKYDLMLWNRLPEKDKLSSLMLDKLSILASKNKKREAGILYKAIKIMFPTVSDIAIFSYLFEGYWRTKRYKEAVKIYNKAGKPFWHSQQVGRYYERRGLIKKAMAEYDRLIKEYFKMKILPLPTGPVELFKLGRWYTEGKSDKAKKYLKLYLKAEECWKNDPAFYLKYKKEALYLLKSFD